MVRYDPQKIENKWQQKWENNKIFKVKEDLKKRHNKYYVLEMYPYPSGEGLHMGHLRNYSIGDVFTRYKRMCGYNVLYPMGYDSFGLPAENAAIDQKANPEEWTNHNIKLMKEQQKRIGLSYDWSRMIYSHDPNYYKWDQWFFLKMFEKDLAYRQESYVNWCPVCDTVLANEQVQSGQCWRCSSEVEQKFLTQWFLRIRNYAEELLDGLKKVDWPKKVKVMQRNWIGRSEGAIIKFPIVGEDKTIDIFTTRADTLFGATFMVFAPEHPWIKAWLKDTKYEKDFKKFYDAVLKQDKFERTDIEVEKKGMFIGKYAINPMTKKEIPIYIGNFVVYEYGAGAVMAVPAHDQRDFEFAKKYNIPIKIVIQPINYELNVDKMTRSYEGDGLLINSEEFNGMENQTAMNKITEKLEQIGMGFETINYKLRDWLISRQRYWGCPIPIIYCDDCGIVPVPYKDLPVELPKDVNFTGKGNPLQTSESFRKAKCPKCGKLGLRETDTMDTFIDSAWYFFRFMDPVSKELPYRKDIVNYWGNVDQYIGGIEHAVMHLLYARFFTKVARDLGLHSFDEPFQRLLTQGMINKAHPYCPKCNNFAMKTDMYNKKCKRCGTEYILKSVKMSKSLGNTVDPLSIMNEYGADAARFFILFGASPESDLEWSDEGVGFANKFIKKVYSILVNPPKIKRKEKNIQDILLKYNLNKTIKQVTENLEYISIRDAINNIIQFTSEFNKYISEGVLEDIFEGTREKLLLLLHPFVPHITEEIWDIMRKESFISLASWPSINKEFLSLENEFKWKLMNNIIDDINHIKTIMKKEELDKISIIIADEWKYQFYKRFLYLIKKTRNQGEIMNKIMQEEYFKPYNKKVNHMVSKALKNVGKYPEYVLSTKNEYKFFQDIKSTIMKKYNCDVEILLEKDSNEQKANQSIPGKPALIIV